MTVGKCGSIFQKKNCFPKEIPTKEKAVNIFAEYEQEVQMRIDTYGDKKRIVDSNPGFETKIKSMIYSDGQYLVITMDNINNIQYLEYISIYINSLLKLILKSPSIAKLKTEISKICSKKLKKQCCNYCHRIVFCTI